MEESHWFDVPPEAGELVWLGKPGEGLGVHFKVSGNYSGGAFSIVEHPVPVGAFAPPHTHSQEDEFSYVVEGEIYAQIGDELIHATPGTYIVKPRGIAHAFWNKGPGPARLVEIISPAGFEEYFVELAKLVGGGQAPSQIALNILSDKYGLEYDTELGAKLAQQHGLNWRSE